jgi:hypothetical protein
MKISRCKIGDLRSGDYVYYNSSVGAVDIRYTWIHNHKYVVIKTIWCSRSDDNFHCTKYKFYEDEFDADILRIER